MAYWRWRTPSDKSAFLGVYGYSFSNEWFKIEPDGWAHLKRSYAFNGASPKAGWSVFDIFRIGTPDGEIDPGTNLPKMFWVYAFHDAVHQFRKEIGMPFKDCVAVFLTLGLQTSFKALGLYYGFVKSYWWIQSRVFRRDRHELKEYKRR